MKGFVDVSLLDRLSKRVQLVVDIGVKQLTDFIKLSFNCFDALKLEMRGCDRVDSLYIGACCKMIEHRGHILLLREPTDHEDLVSWVNFHELLHNTFYGLWVVAHIEVDKGDFFSFADNLREVYFRNSLKTTRLFSLEPFLHCLLRHAYPEILY